MRSRGGSCRRGGPGAGTPPSAVRQPGPKARRTTGPARKRDSDEVAEPVPARPGIPARTRAVVAPAGEGLQSMVSSTQAGEVLGRGLARWSVLVVRLHVVEV